MKSEIGVVVTGSQRPDQLDVDALGKFSVATIHEAMGREGLLRPYVRPIYQGAKVCGPAVTVLTQPGDNWMLHVAAEQIRHGDVVVVGCTSDNTDGMFGDLLATLYRARGAQGLVIDAGVRDVSDLIAMQFPVFPRTISARGTVKSTLGSVNVPIVCAGQIVEPCDIVIGDDDGVVVVSASRAKDVVAACVAREEKESKLRERFGNGELGLDIFGMRETLKKAGLRYL
ncbi:4-carboxy-4-hydroxy-2-oxoadipate aldolase/oxaloacetate decarboxylase [Paraburkholderia tropica]|uniref:4-carboxy-4-hydroxy-2-oxoadipate aldolase/oxaloacetate decarboxylase n=1 Tax=Paraburkholderia tropica TaxID=92647 RepID=UPI002AB675CF|nr:4-carboxy-4-hydroxy-2-oxoadipate aldolase/oxaloacetate decarboxylase [Paraburkholderia tropica]